MISMYCCVHSNVCVFMHLPHTLPSTKYVFNPLKSVFYFTLQKEKKWIISFSEPLHIFFRTLHSMTLCLLPSGSCMFTLHISGIDLS